MAIHPIVVEIYEYQELMGNFVVPKSYWLLCEVRMFSLCPLWASAHSQHCLKESYLYQKASYFQDLAECFSLAYRMSAVPHQY